MLLGFFAGDSSTSVSLLDAAVFLRRFFGGPSLDRASLPLEISPMSASELSSEVSINALMSRLADELPSRIERCHSQLTCKLSLSLYHHAIHLVSLRSSVLASSLSLAYHHRGQIFVSSFSASASHRDLAYVEIL